MDRYSTNFYGAKSGDPNNNYLYFYGFGEFENVLARAENYIANSKLPFYEMVTGTYNQVEYRNDHELGWGYYPIEGGKTFEVEWKDPLEEVLFLFNKDLMEVV